MGRIRLASLVLSAATLVTPQARGADSLIVDIGDSVRVPADQPFNVTASIEGAEDPVSVAWSAEGCSFTDTATLLTTATCSEPGLRTIAVSVTAANGGGGDTLAVVVVREFSEEVARTTGHADPGLPDELVQRPGQIDQANESVPFTVPSEAATLEATLSWTTAANDLDLELIRPDGGTHLDTAGHTIAMPEHIVVERPDAGAWTGVVEPRASAPEDWTFVAVAHVRQGDIPLPSVVVPGATGRLGDPITLTASPSGGKAPYAVRWERTAASNAFDDAQGTSFTFTFTEDTTVKARVTDARGLEATALANVREPGAGNRPPLTVVAVVDNGFSPYHYDFLGHRHPFNLDQDPDNDLDFTKDPASYLDGYPAGAKPIPITIPQTPSTIVSGYRQGTDLLAWSQFAQSSLNNVRLNWFPGTKIIGAVSFGSEFAGTNATHGTRSAASAAGNLHGTCPECVFVLIVGGSEDGLRWAASQPWIDVVTNSYGNSTTPVLRDNIYLDAPITATRAAVESGQTIVFSAGNGLANAYDVPMFTYWSSQKGPDWTITVGAVTPGSEQTYLGHGKPVDISSIGSSYPSTGGTTATGTGTHSGTSNAAPVTAGMFAKVIQEGREALGDLTVTHAGGVVASGDPVPCGQAVPACALGDGVLTRREVQDLVFGSVLPSPQAVAVQTIPTTEYAYYYQGHGTLTGRMNGDTAYREEWEPMVALARGTAAPPARPAGESNWFVVDSECRQKLWGTWPGGYYTGASPALDAVADPIASAYHRWCSALPPETLAQLGDD